MSDQIQPNQNASEEIDLGQLFKLIGNAFNRFFRFIGNIFKGLFNFLLLLLVFIQTHIIKLAIAGIVGLGLGVFWDIKSDTRYESVMVLEPNFNSAKQLYNSMEYYNSLAEAEDSITLGLELNISPKDASTIKEITIVSDTDENQRIKSFDEFLRDLDSTTRNAINYDRYIENFNDLNAKFHKITMIATDNLVAKKTQAAIIGAISTNAYFQDQKQAFDESVKFRDSVYKNQLKKIDSIQKLYKEIMIKTADKPNPGTNINLSSEKTGKEASEIELLNKIDEINMEMDAMNLEKVVKANTVNVISSFPTRGVEVKGIFTKAKFWLPLTLIGFTFLFLLLLELNRFLIRHKNSKG